jgi:hypothetical protein
MFPPQAQGDRVMVIGFAIAVRDGKLMNIGNTSTRRH